MEACPFCGVIAETPHDTQEGCIEALHNEIAKAREALQQAQRPALPVVRSKEADEDG
jgi:hypothetical protein